MFCLNKRFYELKVGGGANYALCHNHSLNLHYKAHQLTCYKDSQNSTPLQDKIQNRNNSLNITNICFMAQRIRDTQGLHLIKGI